MTALYAQNHYGCASTPGMILDGVHFKQKYAMDELMAPYLVGLNHLTNLTVAVLDDLGSVPKPRPAGFRSLPAAASTSPLMVLLRIWSSLRVLDVVSLQRTAIQRRVRLGSIESTIARTRPTRLC